MPHPKSELIMQIHDKNEAFDKLYILYYEINGYFHFLDMHKLLPIYVFAKVQTKVVFSHQYISRVILKKREEIYIISSLTEGVGSVESSW